MHSFLQGLFVDRSEEDVFIGIRIGIARFLRTSLQYDKRGRENEKNPRDEHVSSAYFLREEYSPRSRRGTTRTRKTVRE